MGYYLVSEGKLHLVDNLNFNRIDNLFYIDAENIKLLIDHGEEFLLAIEDKFGKVAFRFMGQETVKIKGVYQYKHPEDIQDILDYLEDSLKGLDYRIEP